MTDRIGKEIGRVNWVNCPNCAYRYYCGAPIFYAEGIPAICPKCRHEFDAWDAVEPRFTAKTASDRKL